MSRTYTEALESKNEYGAPATKPCVVKLEKLRTKLDVTKTAVCAPAAQHNYIPEATAEMGLLPSQAPSLPPAEVDTEDYREVHHSLTDPGQSSELSGARMETLQ